MQRLISFLFAALVAVAVALAACSGQTQDLGAGTGGGKLPEGSSCTCDEAGSCCSSGLICDDCEAHPNATAHGGLSLQCTPGRSTCRAPRPANAMCTTTSQCVTGTTCLLTEPGGPSFCTASGSSGALPDGRCRESLDCPANNVCVESNCKLGRGASCTKSSECASNACYGPIEGCR